MARIASRLALSGLFAAALATVCSADGTAAATDWPGDGSLPATIIVGSSSGGLYSIKASDGTLNSSFGENGVINLKTPDVMQTGVNVAYSLLSSATIYKNLIIIGAGTGEGAGGSN